MTTNTDMILKIENAKSAVRLAKLSLDPKKAPRYSKETIEAERKKAMDGLADALELLQLCNSYLLTQWTAEKAVSA